MRTGILLFIALIFLFTTSVSAEETIVTDNEAAIAIQKILDEDAEAKMANYHRRMTEPLYPGDLITETPIYKDQKEMLDLNCGKTQGKEIDGEEAGILSLNLQYR